MASKFIKRSFSYTKGYIVEKPYWEESVVRQNRKTLEPLSAEVIREIFNTKDSESCPTQKLWDLWGSQDDPKKI